MEIAKTVDRKQLIVRKEPYWRRVRKGAYIGYRAGPNTWIARARTRSGTQRYKALGDADSVSFDDALREAEKWFGQVAGHAARTPKRGTVADALQAYLGWLEDSGRSAAAADAKGRFRLLVDSDVIATLRLEDVTREDVIEWRARVKAGRHPRTVNRHVRAVVAGLNQALRLGFTGSPTAWRLESLVDSDDHDEVTVFLSAEQRQSMISTAAPYFSAYLRGLNETGARPGELARARVSDFDGVGGVLTLRHKKGRGVKTRVRTVYLPEEAIPFFKEQTKDREAGSPLFPTSNGGFWDRHTWAKTFRKVAEAVNKLIAQPNVSIIDSRKDQLARIPDSASAYSFRHARISELLQIYKIDPIAVARQTGTSLGMIEKFYFRFLPSTFRSQLQAVHQSKIA
jgi:integrase